MGEKIDLNSSCTCPGLHSTTNCYVNPTHDDVLLYKIKILKNWTLILGGDNRIVFMYLEFQWTLIFSPCNCLECRVFCEVFL